MAAVATLSPVRLVERLSDIREEFYRSLPTFPTFGKGWLRRLHEVEATARVWASVQ